MSTENLIAPIEGFALTGSEHYYFETLREVLCGLMSGEAETFTLIEVREELRHYLPMGSICDLTIIETADEFGWYYLEPSEAGDDEKPGFYKRGTADDDDEVPADELSNDSRYETALPSPKYDWSKHTETEQGTDAAKRPGVRETAAVLGTPPPRSRNILSPSPALPHHHP